MVYALFWQLYFDWGLRLRLDDSENEAFVWWLFMFVFLLNLCFAVMREADVFSSERLRPPLKIIFVAFLLSSYFLLKIFYFDILKISIRWWPMELGISLIPRMGSCVLCWENTVILVLRIFHFMTIYVFFPHSCSPDLGQIARFEGSLLLCALCCVYYDLFLN